MRRAALGLSSLLVFLSSLGQLRGGEPAADPNPEISIGEMRIQTIPAMSYLFTPAETAFAEMAQPVIKGMERIFGAATEAKLLIARPTMLVYQGNPHFHPTERFKMEIGVIVAQGTAIEAQDDLKIRRTEPFKCATILYTGPVKEQGQAYQKLIPAIAAAGLRPTGEEREMCLYWEGPESASNVFMMMIGIE
jgi:DNA gyrase inhibitor GyrI